MQEDSYQGDGLNLYAYCGNNPAMYYDPSGYMRTPSTDDGCPPKAKVNDTANQNVSGDDKVTVYRGTSNRNELDLYDETGALMSDSARRAYRESGGDIDYAFDTSQKDHEQWIDIWGDENTYIQAHGEFGTELQREFGLERSMVLVATDRGVAEYYAGKEGCVLEIQVSVSELHLQTIVGAGEQEYLIFYGTR